MKYTDFKSIHKDKLIIVCGCGTSVLDLKEPEKFITIGVNDISRLFKPNYVVVLNDKPAYKPADRWPYVIGTTAPAIFTHMTKMPWPDPSRVVEIKLGKHGGVDFEKDSVDYSSNSTYVACIIAGYLGASRIGVIGVDFTPGHFFGQTGTHNLAGRISSINSEYEKLRIAMETKGIELFNLSHISRLSLPKKKIDEL